MPPNSTKYTTAFLASSVALVTPFLSTSFFAFFSFFSGEVYLPVASISHSEEETASSEEESEETEVAEEEESEETEVAEGEEESADTDVKVATLEDKESVEKEVEKTAKQIETEFFKDQPKLTAEYRTVLVDSREIYSEVPKNFFTQASLDSYNVTAYEGNNLNDYSQQNDKLVNMQSNILN